MTPFASIALFRRGQTIIHKQPRKEFPSSVTQARKAAMRYWRGRTVDGEQLSKVFVVREYGGKLQISECVRAGQPWIEIEVAPATAAKDDHLAACMTELGIDWNAALLPVPDVLVINGFTYRRDI